MKLPKYHETFIPILEVLNEKGPLHYRKLITQVIDKYYSNLPQELLNQKTSTGENILVNRINWWKSYLKMWKFVDYPKRWMVQITEKGKKALKKGNLTLQSLQNDPDFVLHRDTIAKKKKTKTEEINIDDASPQELIDKGFFMIESEVKSELLNRLKNIDPYYFEKIILILLKKMWYGDFIETSKSKDGGIDGIINEDQLGLEKIYIQAKRYNENKVTEKDIRNFIGAMSGDTLKGIFITTSSFNEKAVKKANDAQHKIILIDGNKLVDLMYQYEVGVQVHNIYKIKKIDEDFFEDN